MQYLKRIADLNKYESTVTGGKAANLGELSQNNFNVPGGFCVTGPALDYVIEKNRLMPEIRKVLNSMDFESYDDIAQKALSIRTMITEAKIPEDLNAEIKKHIAEMKAADGKDPFVAVRSSVSVKDSDITSFPGMMDTYHFIRGEQEIFENIRECWASLFTGRAVYRRHQQNIPQDKGVIAPVVQKMVNSDVAGVLFTANPINSSRKEIVIEANWGLGESLVSGAAIVDYFVLDRGENDELSIKQRKIMNKNIIVTIDKEKGIGRKQYDLSEDLAKACTLNDEQLLELSKLGLQIEKVFGVPQDVELAY
nr:PEP/pyruvate-binding domain-containing protein [Spirochaetales bacterium]